MSQVDLFDTLERLFTKESLDHLDYQIGNSFILLRFLAFHPAFVHIAHELFPYMQYMSFKELCVFLQDILPKSSGFYFKNLAPTIKQNEIDKQILRKIQSYFNCNEVVAYDYKKLLENQGLDLIQFFGINLNLKKEKV